MAFHPAASTCARGLRLSRDRAGTHTRTFKKRIQRDATVVPGACCLRTSVRPRLCSGDFRQRRRSNETITTSAATGTQAFTLKNVSSKTSSRHELALEELTVRARRHEQSVGRRMDRRLDWC